MSEAPIITPDANKTPLTRQITGYALMWLRENGFKPLAAEVPVAEGWVADVAGMSVLTRTEAIRLKLFKAFRRGYPYDAPQEEIDAYLDAGKASEAAFAAIPAPLSTLLEVKVSRADFRKDLARKFCCPQLPAHLCYVAIPSGLLSADEYPKGWGVLVLKGGKFIQMQVPTIQTPTSERALVLAWQLGCKIDNDQRYERLREAQKGERAGYSVQRQRSRVQQVAYWMADLVDGREPGWAFDQLPPEVKEEVRESAKRIKARIQGATV